MEILAGTSGYSYPQWKGAFYPLRIKPEQMLDHYGRQLGTVEINNTFYRMPKRQVVENWRRQVPAGFRFAIKASRRITHNKALQDKSEPLAYLFESLEPLGDSLGCVLFQLPPYLRQDLDLLKEFMAQLPAQPPVAIEFRHPSWSAPETYELLRQSNAALVASDTDEKALQQLQATADWGYLRLRRSAYGDTELHDWRQRIAAQPWRRAYVYFKHEDDAAGPAMAARFLAIEPASRSVAPDPA